jgi:diguanylate cyclase (GGDEF)-like protein/PAS domain S-box-containing protein
MRTQTQTHGVSSLARTPSKTRSRAMEVWNSRPFAQWLDPLDIGLVAIAVAMVLTDKTVLLFHFVFILLAIGAFFWQFRAFVLRSAFWVMLDTAYVFQAVYSGKTQVDERIEIPLLASILAIIYGIARQRAIAEQKLRKLNTKLETTVEQRTAELIRSNQSLRAEIDERQVIEAALRESEERYALVVKGSNDGLWDWDIKTGKIYFSPRWQAMLGYQDGEIEPEIESWFSRVHPDDLIRLKQVLLEWSSPENLQMACEYRILHQDGTYRWMLGQGVAVYDTNNVLSRLAGSQCDINQRKNAEEQLVHDAFHDGLTHLPNRNLFLDRLARAIESQKHRQDQRFVILFIDLDRFKLINDSLGHAYGDQLLSEFAQRISDCVRSCDTVSRLGGDEFAILLEDMPSVQDADRVIQRIQATLAIPFQLGEQEVYASASIGIASSREDYARTDEALQDADTAMYRAKRRGKGQSAIFDQSMHTQSLPILQLENDLGRAIERKELQAYYQPIINLQTGELVGFEALLRWLHPQRGMISPAEFIPIAEETGLIVPIGDWVLRSACAQMNLWHEQSTVDSAISMSVNLSPRQFTQPNLINKIEKILTETKLKPQNLKLEITESVLMENPKLAASILADLKKSGVQLYLDDFGTGYSSLSYLQKFPVDALKIDRSFICNLHLDNSDAKIVQTIITLAQHLGISIVAEGIETQQHLCQLKDMSCQFGQGYYFEKPMDAKSAETFLKRRICTDPELSLLNFN